MRDIEAERIARVERAERVKPLEPAADGEESPDGTGKGKVKATSDKFEASEGEGKGRRWADVYQYAFSAALSDIVGNLEEMERFTREVCGDVAGVGDD